MVTAGSDQTMSANWEPVVIAGDDGTQVHTVQTTQAKPDGYMHIWVKFQLPGGIPRMLHAKIELGPIERDLAAQEGIAMAGKFGDRIKRAARKVARSKLVRGVVKTVKRAINNPLVKAALSATLAGAAMYATRAAARVAAKAIKGNRAAKSFISGTAHAARRGHPSALAAMRLIRCGVRQHVPRLAATLSGDETRDLMIVGGWGDSSYPVMVGIGADPWDAQGPGIETEREIDAVNEFASAGAWEGVRWVVNRLGLHSMDAHPNEFSRRDALLSGRAAMASRFG